MQPAMFIIYLLRGFVRFLLLFVGTMTVRGRENIPAKGSYIIVVNHMSKADAPLVFLAFPPMQMRFLAGEKWKSHPLIGPLLTVTGAIFINRGEVDRRALRDAMKALQNGSVFGVAPEGTRSRTNSLIKAKDGAAYLASRADIPILPTGLVNTDQVAVNLPRLRRTKMEVRVGELFTLPELGRRAKGQELEAYTHLIMVNIANLLPERYHGYYADSPALAALQRGEDPWPYCLEIAGVEAA
jgi:1-acyl-sn-glycerol-3-phosphate acyltransferase